MASEKCKACGGRVASTKEACCYCGAKPSTRRSSISLVILGLVVVAVFSRAMEMAKTGSHGLSMYVPW